MNATIELHDSTVIAIESRAGSVVVRLDAYVHRSEGRPGIDPGSGWSQTVDLVFAGGVVEKQPSELPCWLSGGNVSAGVASAGMIPLPSSVLSSVRFEAIGLSGDQLIVRSERLEVVEVGEGRFVEAFPGTQ